MARLPVLMYHNVTPKASKSTGLTISVAKLEEHLIYLAQNKYTSLFVSELQNESVSISKNVVITFDDVTENQLLYALPLLKKHQMKATFFIPFSYLGKTDLWNDSSVATCEKIMTVEQLKSLDTNFIELGHHSFFHKKYAFLTENEIQDDFDKSFQIIKDNNLTVFSALAYPYGNYPKKENEKLCFFKLLEKNNIKMAFRIGNRVNRFPFKNKYEIQRIDIKGQDGLLSFKWKLRIGKLRLF